MNFWDCHIDNKEKLYLILAVVFSMFCTLKMATFCLSGGILNPDISLYLISALKYAGLDYFNITNPADLYFTPVISFLTSLFFRAGIVDKSAIIIVTSIFGFFGYIGLYILLKFRFDSLLSFTGLIIYGSFSVVIVNLAKGLIDIPLISITLWVLIFTIVTIKENPKFYLIVFPLFCVAFFVKYLAGFILPVMILYYLMNKDVLSLIEDIFHDRVKFKEKFNKYLTSMEFKYILIGISISFLLAIIICKTLILDFGGSLSFFGQSVNTFNTLKQTISSGAINFNPDKSFYFDNLQFILFQRRQFDFELYFLLVGVFLIGLLLKVINLIKNRFVICDLFNQKKFFKNNLLDKILIFIIILSVVGVFVGFIKFSNHMISNISLLIGIFSVYLIFQRLDLNNENNVFFLLFLSYLLVYFIFISLYQIKVYRYILPIVPPLVYFIIWSLEGIVYFVSNKFDDYELFKTRISENNFKIRYTKIASLIPIIIILILLISTVLFMVPMQMNKENNSYDDVLKQGFVSDLTDASEFIKNNDTDYHNKTFASYLHHERTIRWHLNVNVTILDEEDANLNDFDGTDYIILKYKHGFNNYHKIKKCGDFNIYAHD